MNCKPTSARLKEVYLLSSATDDQRLVPADDIPPRQPHYPKCTDQTSKLGAEAVCDRFVSGSVNVSLCGRHRMLQFVTASKYLI